MEGGDALVAYTDYSAKFGDMNLSVFNSLVVKKFPNGGRNLWCDQPHHNVSPAVPFEFVSVPSYLRGVLVLKSSGLQFHQDRAFELVLEKKVETTKGYKLVAAFAKSLKQLMGMTPGDCQHCQHSRLLVGRFANNLGVPDNTFYTSPTTARLRRCNL